MTSPHLDHLIATHASSAPLQVVFIDIVGYAKRKRAMQFSVISEFTKLVNASLESLGRKHEEYATARGVDFHRDVVRVATAFGLAVVFTFDDVPSVASDFTGLMVQAAAQHNRQVHCRTFNKQQWCNCHPAFQVNVHLREGHGVVFREVNDTYCIADSTVDFSQRVPGRGFPGSDDDHGELVGAEANSGPRPQPGFLRIEL
jgi:hypothetical protein